MKEWENPFNPFNSAKVFLWREHLEACAKDNYLPPITCDIDPTNKCNYSCIWCNGFDMLHSCKQQELSEEHLLKLADFFKEWGLKSGCTAGGGEPLINEATSAFLERMIDNKLENGLITNGSLINEKNIKIIAKTCRWVGISVDAATSETYNKVKGIKGDLFKKVIENIKNLAKEIDNAHIKNDLCYKFLLHPYNAHEIYEAAKLAKEIGCKDFHLRPVGWENLSVTKNKDKIRYTSEIINSINEQMNKAFELESSNFHVYGIRHKFNSDFSLKKSFSRCWAIPILPSFAADGNVYLCLDMKGNQDQILCKHQPDPAEILKIWNTDFHKNMVRNVDINKCPRCTYAFYNEAIEKAILNDGMCKNFP